jgi:hypothetical protein
MEHFFQEPIDERLISSGIQEGERKRGEPRKTGGQGRF